MILRCRRFVLTLALTAAFASLTVLLRANTLTAGQELGSPLYSPNGSYRLEYYFRGWVTNYGWYTQLQFVDAPQGRLNWTSPYDYNANYPGLGSHTPQWAAECNHAVMQGDGNFVCYNHDYTQSVWATNTSGHPGAWIASQDDFNLVVYDASGVPIWSIY